MRTLELDRPTDTDEHLVATAFGGDRAALDELIARHLHPAWRIAIVAAPDAASAEQAVVTGMCDGLAAAHRHADPTISVRERIGACTRRAAAAVPMLTAPPPPASGDAVVASFRALPEAWRSAIWLSEVEGGTPEQAAKILGLDRSGAAALTARATAGFRDRLSADIATRADAPECKRVLAKLASLAAGRLTARDREVVESHMRGCGSCALALAALIAPRPALRRLVPAVPAGLALAVAARWAETIERDHRAWLAPWTERAIGAAAAAVMAVGLAGVALLGGRNGDGDGRPQLAAPASTATPSGPASGEGESAAGPLPGAITLPALPAGASGGTAAGNVASSSARGAAAPRSTAATPTASGAPSAPSAPSAPTGPTTPNSPSAPAPAPTDPAAPPPPGPDPTPPDDTATQVVVGVGDAVELGVGDCTGANLGGTALGCDPETTEPITVVVDLPGLPPLGL